MCKAVVVGSLNLDTSITLERMPQPGETIAAQGISRNPGGKGANQAFALGRLGCPVAMVGAVGRDAAGDTLLESLQAAGVDCSCVARREVPTGQAFITVDSAGENAIIILAGANSTVSTADVEKLRPLLAQADCLVLQLEIPLETVAAAAKLARSLGKVVILDPAPAPGPPARGAAGPVRLPQAQRDRAGPAHRAAHRHSGAVRDSRTPAAGPRGWARCWCLWGPKGPWP